MKTHRISSYHFFKLLSNEPGKQPIPVVREKNLVFIIICVLFVLTYPWFCQTKRTSEPERLSNVGIRETKPIILKEIVGYYQNPHTKEGWEHIRTYTYGLYLNLSQDTVGTADGIMAFLKDKASEIGTEETINIWVFTDSTVIPKSFEADNWSTPKSRKRCFAHAVKFNNGSYNGRYEYYYDSFGEFQP